MAKAPAKLKCRMVFIKDPGLLNIQFVIDNKWIQLTCKNRKEQQQNQNKTCNRVLQFSKGYF